MQAQEERIELRIDYSPEFEYSLRLIAAERIEAVGCLQWKFSVFCLIRHSGGEFTYEANNIYFDENWLQTFVSQLAAIREGRGDRAELTDYMNSFALSLHGRRLVASILIREGAGELSTLSGKFEVDYDLFINKLHEQMQEFLVKLREVTSSTI